MKKMWSGRFREPLDPEFEQWQRSFAFDVRLLPDELAASRAYARALAIKSAIAIPVLNRVPPIVSLVTA